MTDKYVLDENGEPREEPDLLKWAQWYETANRVVTQNRIGGYFVGFPSRGVVAVTSP